MCGFECEWGDRDDEERMRVSLFLQRRGWSKGESVKEEEEEEESEEKRGKRGTRAKGDGKGGEEEEVERKEGRR